LLATAGCAWAPPEAFERAQALSAARLAAGGTALVAEQPAADRTARPPVRRARVAEAAAPKVSGETPDPDARERRMQHVVRSVCPTCLGPEPEFAMGDVASRAAKMRRISGETTGQRQDRPPPVGRSQPAVQPVVLPDPAMLTPVSAEPSFTGSAMRLPAPQ
jgi:hypothetical protein